MSRSRSDLEYARLGVKIVRGKRRRGCVHITTASGRVGKVSSRADADDLRAALQRTLLSGRRFRAKSRTLTLRITSFDGMSYGMAEEIVAEALKGAGVQFRSVPNRVRRSGGGGSGDSSFEWGEFFGDLVVAALELFWP